MKKKEGKLVMKKEFSLNQKELTSIIINILTVKLFFIYPKKLIMNSGNAAWIEMIYVSLLIIPILFFLLKSYKRSVNPNLIELSEKVGGKFLKILIGILLTVALFLNLATTIRSYPEIVKMVLLPNTPINFIVLVFAIVFGIAAYFGMESIGRIHSIFIPAMLGILAIFFLFLIPHTKIYNIFPIFGKGTEKIFFYGTEALDFFDDLVILGILVPYARNEKEAKTSIIKGTFISSLLGILIILFYCLIYPYPSSQNFLVPIYQLTRLVGIGDFFQRFEAFFEFIWSFSILLYSSFYILVISIVLRDTFDLKYEKPLIFPVLAVVIILSFGAYDMQDIVFNYWYLSFFTVFMAFGVPIILSMIYKKRRKK